MAEKKSLDSIQVLRGIAALAVVICHSCYMVLDNGTRPGYLNRLGMFRDLGGAGVDVFFVISGFIMVFVAQNAFGRPGAAGQFWLKRLVRIAPLYWLYTTLMLLLILSRFAMKNAVFSLDYTIKSYLFIPAFNPTSGLSLPEPLLASGWTLSYEMFFYLVFGLWILYGRLETLIPFVLCCFAGALIAAQFIGMDSAIGAFFGQPIMFEFLFGVIAGIAYVKGWRLTRRSSLACVAVAAAFFALSIFARPELSLRWIFWGLPAGLLVQGALGLGVGTGRVGAAFVRLGDSSYTLYLQHAFVTLTVGGLLKRSIVVHKLPPDLLIAVVVAVCVWLGWLAHKHFEKPMNQWLAGRLFAPRPKSYPAVADLGGIKPAQTEQSA